MAGRRKHSLEWDALGKQQRERCVICGHHALALFLRQAKLPGHATKEWVCNDEEKCRGRKAEIDEEDDGRQL